MNQMVLRSPLAARMVPWMGTLLLVAFIENGARADLEFKRPIADVGEVRSGKALSHSFAFVNRGPNAVQVTDIRTSCGCLAPRLAKRVFEPGEEGSLVLDINTLSQAGGFHSWQVKIAYRSGNTLFEMPLRLTARVVTEVTVQPAAVMVFADSAVGHEVLLTDVRPQPLSITGLTTSSPQIKTRLAGEALDPFGHHMRRVHLEVDGDYPAGRHDEILDIYTDDPQYRELKVPVTVIKRARQRVATTPAQVNLASMPGRAAVAQNILIRDQDNQTVTVEQAQADHPAVACYWLRGPGPMSTLKIQVNTQQVSSDVLDTVVHVRVSAPVAESITIPVHWSAK
jgi:hypothetical protein